MSKIYSNTRSSSTSTYTRDWQKSVQKEGGMGNAEVDHFSFNEADRRGSGPGYTPPPSKKGFLKRLFECTCFEFDDHSDPVARYRSRHEAIYGPSTPEPIPPYSHDDPHPIVYPTFPVLSAHRQSTISVNTLTTQDSSDMPPVQSHLLFTPRLAGFIDKTQKSYAVSNRNFAGDTTGGLGAGTS
ncbi:hypothetical protein L204_100153 [Cryptococcus depauperatus]|nr:hypothetical protein L204_02365 [Cryptococcus depauperatus CBS 7855]